MSLKAIFKEVEEVKRFVGYATVDYSSNDDAEFILETSEEELNSKIPSDVNGEWTDNRHKFYLDSNGNLAFDSDYVPPEPTGGF